MKRWMVYALAAAVLLTLRPKEMTEVSALIPVELLYINKEAGYVCARTDTGNTGKGRTLEAALKDLEQTAPGRIFLETADYLVVTINTASLLPQLAQVVRPATEVCVGIHADAQAVTYLKAHSPKVTMKDIRAGQEQIPTLVYSEERYHYGKDWEFVKKA